MRQPYRIESLTLKDIGVFEHTHFDFPQIKGEEQDSEKAEIHIFTGPNGCGKSTVLYALAAIFDKKQYENKLLSERFTTGANKVDFSFSYGDGFFFGPRSGMPGISSSSTPTTLTQYHSISQNYIIGLSPHLEFAAFAYSGKRTNQERFFAPSIGDVKVSPFDNALSFDSAVRPQILATWIASNKTKSALALTDAAFDEAAFYNRSLLKISTFIKDVCDLNVSFHLERISLNIKLLVDSKELEFEVLPEGLKSIISWVSDLALRLETIQWKEQRDIFSQPIILFLDEVDIHLHPKWQRRILPAIQKLLPNAQVFVSTHSPFVVGSVEDAYVYRLPEPTKDVCRDPHIPESIPAVPSAAGKSYQLILSEIFDVAEEFDVETEQQLARFKVLKTSYLKAPEDDTELISLAQMLSAKGEELATLVSLELRQVARLLKKNQG